MSSARCTAHSRSSTTGACGSGGSILVSKDAPEKGLSNGGNLGFAEWELAEFGLI
jgi:hypothetical protein